MKFESNLDGLIECLQTMRKYASGDTPVCINLWGDRHYALQSIYYDHDVRGEESIYLEGDYEDKEESSAQFTVEDTTDMIKEVEKESSSFEDDIDKVTDLMDRVMDTYNGKSVDIIGGMVNFKKSYSYLTMDEIRNTINKLDSETLSDLMRSAENLYIEEINNRPTEWNVTGEQAKTSISNFAKFMLSNEQYKEYIDLCNAMGV